MREWKMGPLYLKSVNAADRTVVGIYSVFGNRDTVGDTVWPGSFSKTLQERSRQVLHLWMHDADSVPVAAIKTLLEVPREALPAVCLAEAPGALGGLEVARTYLDTPRGNEILAALVAGVPLQGSFAFDVIKADVTRTADGSPVAVGTAMGGLDEWAVYQGLQDGSLTRNLRELRLWETSDVNWGANAATVAAKSRLDLQALYEGLQGYLAALHKSGARHSAADTRLLNQIHHAVVDLGATLCNGKLDTEPEQQEEEDDAEKSRAALAALTQVKDQLLMLEFASLLN